MQALIDAVLDAGALGAVTLIALAALSVAYKALDSSGNRRRK